MPKSSATSFQVNFGKITPRAHLRLQSHFETLIKLAVDDLPRVASHVHPLPSLCLASLPQPTMQVCHTLKIETLTITSLWRSHMTLQKCLLIRTYDGIMWFYCNSYINSHIWVLEILQYLRSKQ
jgi:hypothetical protein